VFSMSSLHLQTTILWHKIINTLLLTVLANHHLGHECGTQAAKAQHQSSSKVNPKRQIQSSNGLRPGTPYVFKTPDISAGW
jgi:hypothetical protein